MEKPGSEATATERVPEGQVRVDALGALPRLLREHGVAPGPFLAELGLAADHFEDPRNSVSVSLLGRLLERAVARTGCSHFGLLVGRGLPPDGLGTVGLLARHAPDVRTALRNLARFLPLRDRGGIATLAVDGELARLGYSLYHHAVVGGDQMLDVAMAVACELMRRLCGPAWKPTRVLFAHRSPPDPALFRRYFCALVRFDAERTELAFPARDLAMRCAESDARVYEDLVRRAASLAAGGDGELPGELRRLLRAQLLDGSDSVANAARELAVHRRTLNRRLRAHGTSVRRLDQEVRYEAALQLVEHTELPLVEVAAALGYGDASAFTRAFRRWSGTAPAAWREARRADAGLSRAAAGAARPPAASSPVAK